VTSLQESVVPDGLVAEFPNSADHHNQMAKIAVDLAVLAMNAPTPEFKPLSTQQTQTIELVSSGYDNGQIAQELNISEETIKSILRVSFKKLGARNRNHAMYRAFEEEAIERKKEIEPKEIGELRPSEHQVLQLIASGFTDKEIALERNRSVWTINSQVRKILEKLGTNSRTGAVRTAIEADILPIYGEEIKNRRKILETASFLMTLAFAGEEHKKEDEDAPETRPRPGMYLDWIAETLIAFNGRTLRLSDVAGVVYQEEYDPKKAWVSANKINAVMNNSKSSSSLKNRLSQRGYKYFRFHIKQPQGTIEVRLTGVPIGTEASVGDINESTRPTDEEIKEIAAKIRQDEINYIQQKADEKARLATQKERERQERDNNTPPGRLAVFLDTHRNEPFPIAELVPIAFPDSEERLAVLKQKISKIINDGSLHRRLDGREASLHKANFRPEGYKLDTAVLVCTGKGELSQRILELEADQERKNHEREVDASWAEHVVPIKRDQKVTARQAKKEYSDWNKSEIIIEKEEKRQEDERRREWQAQQIQARREEKAKQANRERTKSVRKTTKPIRHQVPLTSTKPKTITSKKFAAKGNLGKGFTDLQKKLLAREMLVDKGFRKHIKLTSAHETFLRALVVGISIEEVAEKSKKPVEEIEELLRIGNLYLDFLPKNPTETESASA